MTQRFPEPLVEGFHRRSDEPSGRPLALVRRACARLPFPFPFPFPHPPGFRLSKSSSSRSVPREPLTTRHGRPAPGTDRPRMMISPGIGTPR